MKTLDISELRIGNLFIWGQWESEMTADDYMNMYVNGTDQVYGIPLTAGWLRYFGFETMDAEIDFMEYAIEKGGTIIFSVMNDGGLNFEDNNPFYITSEGQLNGWACTHQITIHYVHQLQNLYFALTGEELKGAK